VHGEWLCFRKVGGKPLHPVDSRPSLPCKGGIYYFANAESLIFPKKFEVARTHQHPVLYSGEKTAGKNDFRRGYHAKN